MSYKLLALDVDGTLVGRESVIAPADRTALADVTCKGIRIALCTGRAPKACTGIMEQLGLDGFHAFYDGSLVTNPHTWEEIYVRPLEITTVRQAVDFAHNNGIDFELYSPAGYFAERETWSTNAHRDFFGVEPVITDFDRVLADNRIVKGGLVATGPEEAKKVLLFNREFAHVFHFTWVRTPAYPGVDFINVTAPGVSKGRAVTKLAGELGIGLTEVMAIGDGTNDISLLESAGLAVAMAEAPEALKARADFITMGVEEGGVAAAVRKFLL